MEKAEKGSRVRIFKMSSRLIRMLNRLPREGERVLAHFKNLNSMNASLSVSGKEPRINSAIQDFYRFSFTR
jgi:hypothetical protein